MGIVLLLGVCVPSFLEGLLRDASAFLDVKQAPTAGG
jgi:hypothetical protein